MNEIKDEKGVKEKAAVAKTEKQHEKVVGLEAELGAQQTRLREINKEVVATLHEPAKGWVETK